MAPQMGREAGEPEGVRFRGCAVTEEQIRQIREVIRQDRKARRRHLALEVAARGAGDGPTGSSTSDRASICWLVWRIQGRSSSREKSPAALDNDHLLHLSPNTGFGRLRLSDQRTWISDVSLCA